MNIVVITEMQGIDVFNSWREMQKHYNFTKEDFEQVEKDFILKTDIQTAEIYKDLKILERAAAESVFKKQKMSGFELLSVATFAFSLFIYFKLGSLSGDIVTNLTPVIQATTTGGVTP